MTPRTAILMADYNRWLNRRMYDAACTLSEEEIKKDRGAFFGSIFQTLGHIAAGDTIWLHRFSMHPDASTLQKSLTNFSKPTSLRQEIADSMIGLRDYREKLDRIIVDWSQSLTSQQLDSQLAYSNMAGQSFSKNFGFLVQHFFNHQTHHRGQVSTLLFQAGVDIGVTDLLAVMPNEA